MEHFSSETNKLPYGFVKNERRLKTMAYYDFPFSIRDVCELEGIRLPNDGRANYTTTCPACGKRALTISTEKNNFHCYSCDVQGGLLQLYVVCENRTDLSLSEARKEIMERLFGYSKIDDSEKQKEYQKRVDEKRRQLKENEIPQSQLRCEEDLHATNSELLNILTLSKDHFEDLVKRGLPNEVITSRKYRTYPVSAYQEIPLKIMEEGLYVDGVPGFYRNNNGKWELAQLKRGIMIPIINHHNLIIGFQIRKDNALLKEWAKKDKNGKPIIENGKELKEKENKFTWLSSRGKKDGAAVVGSIHYACDFTYNNGSYVPMCPENKGIVLTEGPLKADIFYSITKYPAMAVPGVSCQNQLEKELDFLKELGFEVIYNAYDMDYMTNENVYKALKASYELILGKGFKLKRLVWNEKDKGLDDHYVSIYKK